MNEKMTFEEAVDIVIQSEVSDACGDYSAAFPNTRDRARAIIDAAVNVHRLTVALESDPENIDLLGARGRAYIKLRDLENGKPIKSKAREMEDLGFKKRPMWQDIPKEPEDDE